MRKLFYLFSILFCLSAAYFGGAGWAVTPKNPICPVMRGERTSEKFYTDRNGERIYFCCRSCLKKFKKNPDQYPVI